MIKIDWTKYKTEYKSIKERYYITEGEIFVGLIDFKSENQTQDNLVKGEYIKGLINNIPFADFSIHSVNNKFGLSSRSEISLKDYKPLNYKIERWGEFDTIDECKNKAMSIIKGFQVYLGTGKINDGEYLK
jgi:hypothetical protein